MAMLDLAKVQPMLQRLGLSQQEQAALVAGSRTVALETLGGTASDWQVVSGLVSRASTSWLLAYPFGPLPVPLPLPSTVPLGAHAVVAADGSQIAPDRHEVALCCLINVGRVLLRYGDNARASLTSFPVVHYEGDDLQAVASGERGLTGSRAVAQLRSEAEWSALSDLIRGAADEGVPCIALLDGSLILWGLQTEPERVRRAALAPYFAMLANAREAGVPLVGYISRPGSRDVINTLRVCRCPHDVADCDRHCPLPRDPERRQTPCADVSRLSDAELYASLLEPGQRSAVFASRSVILGDYPDADATVWFYLHVGPEVARIELPRWVADDAATLDLVHAAVWEQARLGDGYPPALAEAHEQAVVRGPDRQAFFQLVEREYVRAGVPVKCTRKALAKRRRTV